MNASSAEYAAIECRTPKYQFWRELRCPRSELLDRVWRGAWVGRRVWQRKVRHVAGHHAAAGSTGAREWKHSFRRRGTIDCSGRNDARPARESDGDDLPGADDGAESTDARR